jgi:hypothetical protein
MGPAPVPFFGALPGFGSPHAGFLDFGTVQNVSRICLLSLDEHQISLKINRGRQDGRKKEMYLWNARKICFWKGKNLPKCGTVVAKLSFSYFYKNQEMGPKEMHKRHENR